MFAGLPIDKIYQGVLSQYSLTVYLHLLHIMGCCYWYEDEEEGVLYIADGHCDGGIHGPNSEKADQMRLAMAKHGPVHLDKWVESLLYIPEHLHRFDLVNGFTVEHGE